MSKVAHVEMRWFRFACPECGMTDEELGHLATADDLHCMVCLVDEERHVLLRRWLVEESPSPKVRSPEQHDPVIV